jgi:hypothetical protein
MRFSQPPTNCVDTEGSRRLRPDHRRCRYRPPAVPGPEIQGSNTNERVDSPDCSVSTANANLLQPARSTETGLGCECGKRELFACDADSIPDDDANRDDADHNAGSAGLRSLLVRDPYASQLLDGDCAAQRDVVGHYRRDVRSAGLDGVGECPAGRRGPANSWITNVIHQ